jgi:DNA-directed RNA polymerase specialized sigma24 family protein
MVGAMAKFIELTNDDLVFRARTQAEALGRLYEMYYQRIFSFCVHRLFNKEIAEDITSAVFLEVARSIRLFRGRTVSDFQSWLYAIAANQANAYIRKTSRRKKLLEQAAASMTAYDFEKLQYEQIAQILNIKETTLRVSMHRILKELQNNLKVVTDGEI